MVDEQADLLNRPPGSSGFSLRTVAKGSAADDMGLRGATMIANLGGQQIPLGGDILLSETLAPLGVTHLDMPATPGRIWRAIRRGPPMRAAFSV